MGLQKAIRQETTRLLRDLERDVALLLDKFHRETGLLPENVSVQIVAARIRGQVGSSRRIAGVSISRVSEEPVGGITPWA